MFRFIVHDLCSRGYAVQLGNLTQCLLWLKYSGDCFLCSLNNIMNCTSPALLFI